MLSTIEFETPIKNGIVNIPKEYKEIQQLNNAKIIVVFDNKIQEKKKLNTISINTKEFIFNREEANER